MRTNYLFPNQFKKIGWMIFTPTAVLGLLWLITTYGEKFLVTQVFALIHNPKLGETEFFAITKNEITDEILGILLIVSAIFIAFSKEKNEDEFLSQMRLESLVWATYLNYAILILAILFVYDFAFFWVLVFNMFTVLLFFIIRFNWVIYKSKKLLADEKQS